MKIFLAIIGILLFLTSCEDIIEIDLNSIEPKLVIEGFITDQSEPCTIKLSLTGDYFDPGIYPPISGAAVTVEDMHGTLYTFEETEPGFYTSASIQGISNTGYAMEVWTEGEHYQAEVTMPECVNIDYLTSVIPSAFYDFEEGYMVNCHFMDPGEYNNFYRMKAYLISDPNEGRDSKLVFSDQFQNGNPILMEWEFEAFMPFDTVVVELQTLAKSTYDYYYTLFPITEGGIFGASNPSNPQSNISNDALGYFGTFTVSRDTIVILPEPF